MVTWGGGPAYSVPVGLFGVTAIAAGQTYRAALKSDGTVVAWGGAPTVPASLAGVTAIAAGGFHTVAIVQPPPNITYNSSGNSLTLLWSDTAAGYRVESALLTPSLIWNNVTGTLQTNGGFISIALPMSGSQKFFRLAKP